MRRLGRHAHRKTDLRVEQERRREDGPAREMVAEERRRLGDEQRRVRRDARDAAGAHDARRRDAAETARRRARATDEFEARRELHRRIELLDGQHRTEAVDELDHVRSVNRCAPRVGDRVLVAALDVDSEIERAAGCDRGPEARLVGERGDGPSAKADVRHRDPCRELPDSLGDEAGRKRTDVRRHRIASARAPPRIVFDDAVDERECREVITHALS